MLKSNHPNRNKNIGSEQNKSNSIPGSTSSSSSSRSSRKFVQPPSLIDVPKSLYMERRQAIPLRTGPVLRNDEKSNTNMPKTSLSGGTVLAITKETTLVKKVASSGRSTFGANSTRSRVSSGVSKKSSDAKLEKVTVEKLDLLETGVQTMENEILQHEAIVGDIKYMYPSRDLVFRIERDRKDAKRKAMMKQTREFGPSEVKYERHLDNLKEFLERGAISRRPKIVEDLEENKNYLRTMDEIMSRKIPKTESITDIKGRIKKKEHELLSMFDDVEALQHVHGNENISNISLQPEIEANES